MKNYGFKLPEIKNEDYVFGGLGSLPKIVLQQDGQWDSFLVPKENQNLFGVETYACTCYGSLSAIEILINRLYGKVENFSDRFLSWASGIDWRTGGGDPQRAIETLRKGGVPHQEYWDFTPDIKSTEDFYKNPPTKLLEQARDDFLKPYFFQHEYVNTSLGDLKEALRYSPLALSVSAWYSKDGIYNSNGNENNHWVVCYGYDDTKRAWKIFDSYENNLKLYSYEGLIRVAKRFYITTHEVNIAQRSTLEKLIEALLRMVGLLKKVEPVAPVDKPVEKPVDKPVNPLGEWETPQKARHSARVVMDTYGLTWQEKNLLCAVIMAESGFDIKAKNYNKKGDKVVSVDWGLCQINDFYHIGKGKYFKSVDEVLNDPAKSVRFLVEQSRAGHLDWWIAYKNKSYMKYLT